MKRAPNPTTSNEWLNDESQIIKRQAIVPVSRRNFLIGSAAGATALALSPLQKILAASGNETLLPVLYSPEPAPELFSLLLQFARGVATALGFGGLFETAFFLLDRFVLNGKLSALEKKDAQKGLGTAWDMIVENLARYGNFEFTNPKSPVVDKAKQIVPSAFASSVLAGETTKSPQREHHGLLARKMLQGQQPDDKRYFATSYSRNSLNLLVPFFDYEGKNYDPRMIFGRPSLDAYKQLINKGNLTRVYKPEQIKQLIYPKKQLQAAYGVLEQNYQSFDRYDSVKDNRVEMSYEYKGEYKGNDASPGQVYGVVHTSISGLECEDTRKRKKACHFADDIIWMPKV